MSLHVGVLANSTYYSLTTLILLLINSTIDVSHSADRSDAVNKTQKNYISYRHKTYTQQFTITLPQHWSFDAHCCHMGTAIEHHVPDWIKPSFAIFDIQALWRSGLVGAWRLRVPSLVACLSSKFHMSLCLIQYWSCNVTSSLQWNFLSKILTSQMPRSPTISGKKKYFPACQVSLKFTRNRYEQSCSWTYKHRD